jgi:hypothetical protein
MTTNTALLGLWRPDWTPAQVRSADPLIPPAAARRLSGEQGREPWWVLDIAMAAGVERQTVWKWTKRRKDDLAGGLDPDLDLLAIPAWLPELNPAARQSHTWNAGAILWWLILKGLVYRDLTLVHPRPPGWEPRGWDAWVRERSS